MFADALSWQNVLMNFDAAADAAGFVSAGHFADIDEVMGPSRGRPISMAQELTQASAIGSDEVASGSAACRR